MPLGRVLQADVSKKARQKKEAAKMAAQVLGRKRPRRAVDLRNGITTASKMRPFPLFRKCDDDEFRASGAKFIRCDIKATVRRAKEAWIGPQFDVCSSAACPTNQKPSTGPQDAKDSLP
jgi:hypothetical protein